MKEERSVRDVVSMFLPILRGESPDDPDAIVNLFSENIKVEDWSYPGVEVTGIDKFVEKYLNPDAEAFAESKHIIHDVIISEDKFVVCATFKGRFLREYLGFKPHGDIVKWTIRDIYEVEGGCICKISLGLNSREQRSALGR